MKKIPTIFERDPKNRSKLLNVAHPNCGWVFRGEGIATQKYDGTCVKIEDGKYFKRREVKKNKPIPLYFVEEMKDTVTGKRVGWVPVENIPGDKYHIEAFNTHLSDGTYELVGPKIQGNPEGYDNHTLISHKDAKCFLNAPRDIKGIEKWLEDKDIEGIVFHHPDGRMGKIKKRDFGQKRKQH